ncbi:hypothetical protein MMC25_004347 [Agyrium rufum]|nr:hypothetical protein [Agyrium rufum]
MDTPAGPRHGMDRGLARIGEDEEGQSDASSGIAIGRTQRPGHRRWRYELEKEGLEDEDDVPLLVQTPISASLFSDTFAAPPPIRPKPPTPSHSFFRSLTASQSTATLPSNDGMSLNHRDASASSIENTILQDYDNLFLTFYNHPPNLNSTNITIAYSQCKSLLTLADAYDSLPIIGPRIDHHLLQFQSRLWKQIAKYPPSYLKLGYLARSKAIYSEALIHVVGQWPHGAGQLRPPHAVPDLLIEIIEDKVEDLQDMVDRAEARLFRLSLNSPSNGPHHGARCTPQSDYLSFLAVSLFRHWLADNTSGPPPASSSSTSSSSLTAPGSRMMRLVALGGNAYLPHDELKRFLKLQPELYSRDNMKRFERRMADLKELARGVVRSLMKSDLELDAGIGGGGGGSVTGFGHGASAVGAGPAGLGYFACTKVQDGDYCW